MQKTPTSSSTPIFSTSIFTSSSSSNRPPTRERDGVDPLTVTGSANAPTSATAAAAASAAGAAPTPPPSSLPLPPPPAKDRKPSFSRKSSLSGARSRRGSSISTANAFVTDAATPPALPEYALAAAAKVAPNSTGSNGASAPSMDVAAATGDLRRLSRTATGSTTYLNSSLAGHGSLAALHGGSVGNAAMWQQTEAGMVHQHITDLANKRISTLDYLRKAHEGRVYWFNTYLFDKPDFARMPYFDPRKLGRKATNHLLLGLSLPTVIDLYSSTPLEFLRSLNTLLSEFDSFVALHGESGSATSSLARARLPNMFRRQPGKSRRSTSAADMHPSYAGGAATAADDPAVALLASAVGGAAPTPSAINFAASESDLLPGEEYSHLLTPSLPFDPDYFETFATLCDVLIDCYSRFLALVPSPRECTAPVAELFTKADSRVRKLIVQGVVKEFEDHSRSHIKTEVGSIGKVVLSGLM